jgi:putative ABC transport system permease protein
VWQDLYRGDPAIVGKPIRFAEAATTIAGVAPRGFDTPHGGDFWFSQQLDKDDINHFFDGYMRLNPGATLQRANAEMAPIMRRLERDFPQADLNRIYVTKPRGAARAREMAVRVAIGASRGRIIRQLLTESVLLSMFGAVLGLVLAYVGVRALLALGASKLPRLDAVAFDARVLGFSLIVLVVSGLLVGFAPALRLTATDVRALMNETTRSATGGRGTARWLSAMTVVEIALAIILVAGAGWLVRGFANLRSTNLGFMPENRLIFDVTFLGAKYPNPASVDTASRTLRERIAALPGVSGVGATSNFPFKNTLEGSLIAAFHGENVDKAHPMGVRQRIVSAGYFQATGTRLLQGRDFGPDDRQGTRRVAIINRMFVTRYLNGRDPIGLQFSAGYPAPDPRNEVTVIGVVDDVRQKTVKDEPEPAFYSPVSQLPLRRQTMVVATSGIDAASLQSAIRTQVRQLDPQIAVEFELVTDLVNGTLRRQQLGMTLMAIFGAVAILLAAVGIYGVVAYAVSQRRSEMATRLALGATPGSVFALVMKQGALLALAGTGIGLLVAYLSGRIVASQIYAIRASDPLMLSAAIVLVAAITALATMIPAWRASRLAPSGVLHTE